MPGTVQNHLQQIIDGLTEGVVIARPDGTLAWANDTALALHGVRRVAELGRTVADYRARFPLRYPDGQDLSADDYPISRLLRGEAVAELTVECVPRSGHRPFVHRIRTLVLTRADNTDPDWLVVIINDETERFNAEARFERAFAANPAPAVIARLADGRYVRMNRGFIELTGWTRERLVGRSMHEVDVLHGAADRELALARLHAGETIPQMEARLPLADGGERLVLLGGQPLEIGDADCMLFTFADLEGRRRAEIALRQSERRFSRTFQLAPAPMLILLPGELTILDVNDAFTATTGWRREEVLGRRESELVLWEAGERRDHLARVLRETGHAASVEIGLSFKDGAGDFLLSAETVALHDRDCLLCVMQDITARKRAETDLRAAIDLVLREDTSRLGQRIVETLANLAGARRADPRRNPELGSIPNRARAVLELMAGGLADDAIAKRLGISRNTVRNHIAAIYDRVGLRKRSSVIVWARERGLGLDRKNETPSRPIRRRKSGPGNKPAD